MEKQIQIHLQQLAEEEGIRILMAVESGSRAWGFPSPDSDYDVRIVYMHERDWYLSVANRKDQLNYFHGELLDINGWDIRKTLGLLRKSNATPFEWAQSPIIYREEAGFREQLLSLARQYFQPIDAVNHYRGIAYNSFHQHLAGDRIKLKKLFYVIRPLLAARWIMQKASVPPMNIQPLLSTLEDAGLREKIGELIGIKIGVGEDYTHALDPAIRNFIDRQFKEIEGRPSSARRETPGLEVLDTFFRKLLK